MGAIMSSFFSPPTAAAAAAAAAATTSEGSKVKAFHSSVEWKNHLKSIRDSSSLMVIDFTASWCGPCKMMEPTVNELSNKYPDVIFVKIDVDELKDVAQEYGVQAMPTFLLIKKGKQVDKIVGAKKDELGRKIEMHRA